jgi:hypothetical protein
MTDLSRLLRPQSVAYLGAPATKASCMWLTRLSLKLKVLPVCRR